MFAIVLAATAAIFHAVLTPGFSENVPLQGASLVCVEYDGTPHDARLLGSIDFVNWYPVVQFKYRRSRDEMPRYGTDVNVPGDWIANVPGILAVRVETRTGATPTSVYVGEACRKHIHDRYGRSI